MKITRTQQTDLIWWIAERYPQRPLRDIVEFTECEQPTLEDWVVVHWRDSAARTEYEDTRV